MLCEWEAETRAAGPEPASSSPGGARVGGIHPLSHQHHHLDSSTLLLPATHQTPNSGDQMTQPCLMPHP